MVQKKNKVREKEKQHCFDMREAHELCFYSRKQRESTSFTLSHLSYKPLDPQGEQLSDGWKENIYKSNNALVLL